MEVSKVGGLLARGNREGEVLVHDPDGHGLVRRLLRGRVPEAVLQPNRNRRGLSGPARRQRQLQEGVRRVPLRAVRPMPSVCQP